MVDFNKLRTSRSQPAATDPREIFRRLPKPAGINDLYVSQAEVLEAWHVPFDGTDSSGGYNG